MTTPSSPSPAAGSGGLSDERLSNIAAYAFSSSPDEIRMARELLARRTSQALLEKVAEAARACGFYLRMGGDQDWQERAARLSAALAALAALPNETKKAAGSGSDKPDQPTVKCGEGDDPTKPYKRTLPAADPAAPSPPRAEAMTAEPVDATTPEQRAENILIHLRYRHAAQLASDDKAYIVTNIRAAEAAAAERANRERDEALSARDVIWGQLITSRNHVSEQKALVAAAESRAARAEAECERLRADKNDLERERGEMNTALRGEIAEVQRLTAELATSQRLLGSATRLYEAAVPLGAVAAPPPRPSGAERDPVCHDLKVWPEFFEALCDGSKRFEVRKADRDFRVGDRLMLREWSEASGYHGRSYHTQIGYIMSGGRFGVAPGYVVLGLSSAPPAADGGEAGKAREALCLALDRLWMAGGSDHWKQTHTVVDALDAYLAARGGGGAA